MDHICEFPRASDPSLLHLALVSAVKSLDNKSLDLGHDTIGLPEHLLYRLLNYIAQYRPRGLVVDELKALLHEKSQTRNSCSPTIKTGLRCLDLSTSYGSTIVLGQILSSPSKSPQIYFPCLTHLSLAHPGFLASWPDLLDFAVHIPSLSRLSLAYWTVPEDESSKGNPDWVKLGDYLSRLSNSLCCLRHLDVEGCNTWVSALRTDAADWNGGWKNVQSLNLSQGPMPIGVQFEGGEGTETWIEGEVERRRIEFWINNCRRSKSTNPRLLQVEHGWDPQNSMLKFVIDKAWEEDRTKWSSSLDMAMDFPNPV